MAQPLGDMTLKKVIASVLTKPMTAAEVMVAVTEAGYRSAMVPRKLQRHIENVLRRGGFVNAGGQWSMDCG